MSSHAKAAVQLEKIELELRELERRKLALLAQREALRQQISSMPSPSSNSETAPPKKIKCPSCAKCFTTEGGLKSHTRDKHERAAQRHVRPDVLPRAKNAAPIAWPPSSTKIEYRPDAHAGRHDPEEQLVRSTQRPDLKLTEDASVNPLIRARLARKLTPGDLARQLGAEVEVILAVEKGRRKTLPREWRAGLATLGVELKVLEAQYRTWYRETENGAPLRRVDEVRAQSLPSPVVRRQTSSPRGERATHNGEFREGSGRFGSYPMHDDYGEDAWPE